jgi:hypothetical protein
VPPGGGGIRKYYFEFQLPICSLKSRIFKFLKRDCRTIPVAEIISGKIDFFF